MYFLNNLNMLNRRSLPSVVGRTPHPKVNNPFGYLLKHCVDEPLFVFIPPFQYHSNIVYMHSIKLQAKAPFWYKVTTWGSWMEDFKAPYAGIFQCCHHKYKLPYKWHAAITGAHVGRQWLLNIYSTGINNNTKKIKNKNCILVPW